MLPFFNFILAQATPTSTPAPAPQEVMIPQKVLPLPGQLDTVPVFNSNSPELVLQEGILLSTFPALGKRSPSAHLNFSFQGRFDIFAHHIAKATSADDLKSLYLGIILYNPSTKPVTVDILQAASYLSQPDAPFIELPSYLENGAGKIYAGPGDRVMNEVLRSQRQSIFPSQLAIAPGESKMLLNLPIPVRSLTPPVNGRSTLMRLQSNGKVYIASLGMYARLNPDGTERAPTLEEWQKLLTEGDLSTPRDRVPTPPDANVEKVIYGRVAGVAKGSIWRATVVDNPSATTLTIPQKGQSVSYVLSTVTQGTLGTQQIQSAPLIVRYPDTAYRAHGNYGIQYSLKLPLSNATNEMQTVSLAMQTPIKQDAAQAGLRFFQTPAKQTFFRGTIQIRYKDDRGLPRLRFIHLVQRRGQQGEPLVILKMPPSDRRLVQVDFLYPPDASPPQVLTIKTIE